MNKVIRVKRTLWDELHTCAGLAPSPSVLNVCVVWLIALLYTRSPPHSSLSRCFECDWNLRECGTIEKSVREEERFLDNWHRFVYRICNENFSLLSVSFRSVWLRQKNSSSTLIPLRDSWVLWVILPMFAAYTDMFLMCGTDDMLWHKSHLKW